MWRRDNKKSRAHSPPFPFLFPSFRSPPIHTPTRPAHITTRVRPTHTNSFSVSFPYPLLPLLLHTTSSRARPDRRAVHPSVKLIVQYFPGFFSLFVSLLLFPLSFSGVLFYFARRTDLFSAMHNVPTHGRVCVCMRGHNRTRASHIIYNIRARIVVKI